MTFRGGDYFLNEMFNRMGARLQQAQMLFYLNESLGVINTAASFPWDQQTELNATPNAFTGQYLPSGLGMDVGKKITVLNSATKTPVQRCFAEDFVVGSTGYTDVLTTEFNMFRIAYLPAAPVLYLNPIGVSGGQIDVYYHALPPTLTATASPTVRWDVPFMDSVLLDMTEAAVKRILSWAGWQDREATSRSKLQEAVRIYSIDRINTGTPGESNEAMQEKTQIGRA